jgi:Tfp pilus assembly protein PilO
MNFERLIETIRKNLVIAISGVVTATCMTVYVLHMDKKPDLESEIEQIDICISTMLRNITNSAGLEKDIEVVKSQISELEERMFQSQELATNYNYFFNIEKSTNVSLRDLKQVEVVTEGTNQKKHKMPNPIVDVYVKIRYDMRVNGTYKDLVNFMRTLEGGPSFYKLEKFRLSKSSAGGDELLSMDVSFLMLGKKAS